MGSQMLLVRCLPNQLLDLAGAPSTTSTRLVNQLPWWVIPDATPGLLVEEITPVALQPTRLPRGGGMSKGSRIGHRILRDCCIGMIMWHFLFSPLTFLGR